MSASLGHFMAGEARSTGIVVYLARTFKAGGSVFASWRFRAVFDKDWFRAKKLFSSGAVEGMNLKVNSIARKAYGGRRYDVLKIALFHALGPLPEPEITNKF